MLEMSGFFFFFLSSSGHSVQIFSVAVMSWKDLSWAGEGESSCQAHKSILAGPCWGRVFESLF